MVRWVLEGWEKIYKQWRELKTEWAELWRTKYGDEVRAEDVSSKEFERLFIDRGEVINATRDYRPLSFREILHRHLGSQLSERVNPDPSIGGWRKFVKEHLQRPKPATKKEQPEGDIHLAQHQRKGGHGWLNRARIWKKLKPSGFVD